MTITSLTSAELRKRFLAFFEARGHTVKPSDGLIPSGDPTVLFTSAGMNQFKEHFLGKRTDLRRAASCQKCLRTGDLERVGASPSHHSFFEMLGNFSFGDYFKREAIQWAWEFLTGTSDYAGAPSRDQKTLCLALPAAKLWVSIYGQDDEAFQLWRRLGVPEERIRRFGPSENFWPANAPTEGPNGPCGPCSEIYFDIEGKVRSNASVEIWNLVFTQFDRQSDGTLKPLPKPNIDTGMGLERLARVIQGVETDDETDLFLPIMEEIRSMARSNKINLADPQRLAAQRTVADHVRAIIFLIAEGIVPSNEGRGYVLRMLIRRMCLRIQDGLGIGGEVPELVAVAWKLAFVAEYAMRESPYARDLSAKQDTIKQVLGAEIPQFQSTLRVGAERLTAMIGRLQQTGQSMLPGDAAFELYDTYGLPLELTVDLANERGCSVDRAGFEVALKAQQERSRAASQFGGGVFVTDALRIRQAIPHLPAKDAHFLGYDALRAETGILGLWDGRRWITQASEGQAVGIIVERSPFYGEAGGQIGDTGRIEAPKGAAEVKQTTWVDDVLMHHATVRQGQLAVNDPVRAIVDAERRLKIARSHTATHLLHWALRHVLGPEAVQAGSYVEAERVRFDVSSLAALREEQRHEVEALVNRRVRAVDPVTTSTMPLDQAKQGGALALFGEKYGSAVRVVTIGDYSKELCGGTHVLHTGFVGSFLIVGESSIASGTRRIEALVGEAAATQQQQQQRLLHEVARRLSRPSHEVVEGLEELLEQLKRSERERKTLQAAVAKQEARELVAAGERINGVTFVRATIKHADRESLAALADAIKQSLPGDGFVCLASGNAPVSIVMATTAGLVQRTRLHAGEMLKEIAPLIQGSGGGRPDFAQGGGKDPSGIPAAFKRVGDLLRQALERAP